MKREVPKLDKTNVEEMLALTPTQAGMLYHHLNTAPGRPFYNQQLCLRISGPVCAREWRSAWQFVTDTNEMLRAIFRWNKLEHPVQILLNKAEVQFTEHDYSSWQSEEKERLVKEMRERDRLADLSLETIPFRVTLCKLDEQTCEMIVNWHHILYDGWSNGILLKEAMEHYEALLSEREPLARKKTRFKEFVKWHQAQDKTNQQRFWEDNLKNLEGTTPLPYEDGGGTDSEEACSVIALWTAAESSAIAAFTQAHRITMAAFLYGIWGVVLHAYSGREDILFGTTVSGREPSIAGIEDMVGLFINTIPFRMQISLEDTVLGVLKEAEKSLREREPYVNTSLVDIAGYRGLNAREGLFDSILVVENYPLDERLRAGGLITVDTYLLNETTPYGLTLGFQTFGELELEIAYNPRRFTRNGVTRIAGHFRKVMEEIIRRPEIRIADINVMTHEETRQILTAFNGEIHEPAGEQLVHLAFERQVYKMPHHIAIIHENTSCTYEELYEQANRIASRLREAGLRPDQPVAIILERSAAFMAAALGVLTAGGCYIPIDHEFASGRISQILRNSGARFLITRKSLEQREASAEIIVYWEEVSDVRDCDSDRAVDRKLKQLDNVNSSTDTAYIIYTSGSTGQPKGVMVEHRSLMSYVEAFHRRIPLNADDIVLQQASCSFDHFVEEVYPALLCGATIVMVQRTDVLDINRLLEIIDRHRITVVTVQPLLLHELNKRGGLPRVHTYISGGDTLKSEHYSELVGKARVFNSYGPTEATVCATYHEIGLEHRYNIPIGHPISNSNVYIMDENNRLKPIGVIGEIVISGSGVARGYLHNPELTAQKFVQDPYRPGSTMYRTGDLGKWLPDGSLAFVGRNDEQIKVRGYRIEPREIETWLLKHPLVEEAIVLAIEGDSGNKSLAAYLKADKALTSRELRDHLADRLPHYMIPSLFYRMERIPMTSNAKVDNKALIQLSEQLDPERMDEGVAGDMEEAIRGIWKRILHREHAGLEEPFFEIGGNSILLMQLLAKLEQEFPLGMTIGDLFAHPTISSQARWIEVKRRTMDRENGWKGPPGQALPGSYFTSTSRSLPGGKEIIRVPLSEERHERIKELARECRVEAIDVWLSMLLCLFTRLNDNKTAIVYQLNDSRSEASTLSIDLTEQTSFPLLFQALNQQRNRLETLPTYQLIQVAINRPSLEPNQILPLVCQVEGANIPSLRLEPFDLIMNFQAKEMTEENESPIMLTCCFDPKRLNREKMEYFMKSYVHLLKQLTETDVLSR